MNFTNDNLAAESYDVADSQEINSYEDYSTDLKFRSIAVESAPTHDDFFFEPEGNAYHDTSVDFSKPYNITSKSDVVPMIITSSSSDVSCGTCPDLPFGIPNNQFIINKSDCREVVQAISDNLVNQHPHHDFSFIEREHMVRLWLRTLIIQQFIQYFIIWTDIFELSENKLASVCILSQNSWFL